MKLDMKPELKVQMELDAHEKECAIRYQAILEWAKIDGNSIEDAD
jgi:hypothetical protein